VVQICSRPRLYLDNLSNPLRPPSDERDIRGGTMVATRYVQSETCVFFELTCKSIDYVQR
jgi:hypothetical protein